MDLCNSLFSGHYCFNCIYIFSILVHSKLFTSKIRHLFYISTVINGSITGYIKGVAIFIARNRGEESEDFEKRLFKEINWWNSPCFNRCNRLFKTSSTIFSYTKNNYCLRRAAIFTDESESGFSNCSKR